MNPSVPSVLKLPGLLLAWIILFLSSLNSYAQAHLDDLAPIPPRTLIVIAHPNPDSFNHAIKEKIIAALEAQNHQVKVRDLYALAFDPLLSRAELSHYDSGAIAEDVKVEQEQILWADQLVFIYPTWWWSMPAMMKGYFDRVFLPGFAFLADEEGVVGLLKGKKAWIIQTTGSDQAYIEENDLDTMVKKPLETGLFNFCGIEVIAHQILPAVPFISDAERKVILENLAKEIKERL